MPEVLRVAQARLALDSHFGRYFHAVTSNDPNIGHSS